MTSNSRSPLIFAVAVVLTSCAIIVVQVSRALAQTQLAQDQKALDRESKAKAQNAAASQSRDAAAAKEKEIKLQAKEAEARAAKAGVIAASKSEPVMLDLSKYLVLTPENFRTSRQYPWGVTPLGQKTLAGVPVEIQGATILWGKRNADRGQKYPEMVSGIPCQQKFETLYILHCVFFEAAKGDPSFSVVLNYEDGKTQSDEILCGEDSKDWWINDPNETIGPSGERSTLAWTGTGKSNDRDQDVRFCLTAIDNKQPDRMVTTIDLVSSKKQAAGVILAITLGKSGLLTPLPEKPAKPGQPKDR